MMIFIELIRAARPVHWTKNLAIFAAIFFSGWLLQRDLLANTMGAFVAFCLASSATYIFNDIFDAKYDRFHPFKKHRPIASGRLPVSIAIFFALFLSLLSLYVSSFYSLLFLISVIAYLVLQVFYSLGLKNIPIIDILIIASGFILRVYAGAFVIDAHLSVWFLLCVISVALFLASGKRRSELNISVKEGVTRKSLEKYKVELLNSYVTMFGNAAWMSWSLFTFFESPKASQNLWIFLAEISKTTTIDKLLMVTIPFSIFGIMRYEALIFEGKSQQPEKLILTDKPLVVSVVLWVLILYGILYRGLSIT